MMVLKSAIPYMPGIIGMPRTEQIQLFPVIPAMGAGIGNGSGKGGAGGPPPIQAAQNPGRVRLLALGGERIPPRRPPCHLKSNGIQIQGQPPWQAVYGDADGRAVGLPVNAYAQIITPLSTHPLFLLTP